MRNVLAIFLLLASFPAYSEEELKSETITVRTVERPWRIEIERPSGSPVVITGHIERARKTGGTTLGSEKGVSVVRSRDVIKDETVSYKNRDVSIDDALAVIALAIEKWRKEDRQKPVNP